MKYVRYKLHEPWWTSGDVDSKEDIKVTFGKVYLFPYFIDDTFNLGVDGDYEVLNPDVKVWKREFKFIKESTFIKESGIDKQSLDIINSLLESKDADNHTIAVEMYKKLRK